VLLKRSSNEPLDFGTGSDLPENGTYPSCPLLIASLALTLQAPAASRNPIQEERA